MIGITGCLVHELLGVDALYPTGGLSGAAPKPLVDPETSFSGGFAFTTLLLAIGVLSVQLTSRTAGVPIVSVGAGFNGGRNNFGGKKGLRKTVAKKPAAMTPVKAAPKKAAQKEAAKKTVAKKAAPAKKTAAKKK